MQTFTATLPAAGLREDILATLAKHQVGAWSPPSLHPVSSWTYASPSVTIPSRSCSVSPQSLSVPNLQVMLLSGETGSGKTTQVPQYILEDAAQK